MERPWRFELLGGLRAVHGDRDLSRFGTQRAAALLAYLAYHLGRRHGSGARLELIELLWPGEAPEAGRDILSTALYRLRQQLAPLGSGSDLVIVSDRVDVRLNPDLVTTDVAEFEATITQASRDGGRPADYPAAWEADRRAEQIEPLARAVRLYRGPLLPAFHEDWVLQEREWLAERYFQALRQLLTDLEEIGEYERALEYARSGVKADPLREEAHQGLIRLLAKAGQPSAARRQYQELERLLEQHLGATPTAATRRLCQEIERLADCARLSAGRMREAGLTTESRWPDGPPRPDGKSPPSPPIMGGASEPVCPAPPIIGGLGGLFSVSPCHRGYDSPSELEPIGGAVSLDSPFYVVRASDEEFQAAINRRDSIVLVKGPRQVGKTSLLARGLHQARGAGARVVWTDLQSLNAVHRETLDALFQKLAVSIADQLELEVSPQSEWQDWRGPSENLKRYWQRIALPAVDGPVVWGLDEVDCIFSSDFAGEVFALFRSWHNERATVPSAPWHRLTLAMAYATEHHLFITDVNQSPFNVGTRITLGDFTREELADLNGRYGAPLRGETELARFMGLVGGHPYLARLGLHEMVTHGADLAALEVQAEKDMGIFSDHLRRMFLPLTHDPELHEAVCEVLQGRPCPTVESFYRLRSAGVLTGDSARDARPRCQLYAAYLSRNPL